MQTTTHTTPHTGLYQMVGDPFLSQNRAAAQVREIPAHAHATRPRHTRADPFPMLHNLPTPPTDLTETLTPRLQQDLQDILAYLDRTLDPATPEHSRLLAKPEDAIRRISEALYNTLTDAATT